MNITGLITEYNPFHYGHLYQLVKAREITGADLVLVLMGGNVVQRGEFAILDKWHRARIALEYGADLVIELPLLASLQAADYFCEVSVKTLSLLECDNFLFGTESASVDELNSFNNWVESNEAELNKLIQAGLKKGHSYAASYNHALVDLRGEAVGFNPTSPNHTLSLQYLKTNQKLARPMKAYALPRIKTYQGKNVYSGSQIRQKYKEKSLTPVDLPEFSYQSLMNGSVIDTADYYPYLRYRLLTHTPDSLREIYGVREGLENRLIEMAGVYDNYADFVQSLISKRWTRSSIQRILLAVLADITDSEWENYRESFWQEPTVRVLGYNNIGQMYLKKMRNNEKIQLFSNFNQKISKNYMLTTRIDRVLQLNPKRQIPDQYLKRYPMKKES